MDLLKNLRVAFDQEQLFLMYQPKIDIQTGNTIGVEALVRWPLPNGDLVSPGVFIPLAEQSGLIIRLGEWILRTALTELRNLNENGWPGLEMGVNLSVAQLQHPALMDMLKTVLSDTGVDPSSVDLEITESIAMRDMAHKSQLISEIKALGFKVSVDDFGTGFSSLNYLQKMPVDCLKIDQTFVHAVNEGNGRDIVELIVTLGRKLNMRVIAEGVETEAQANTVSELGCDEVQGYFFAHPLTREQLHDWLAKRSH
ncbi:putative bifunctional diguanylate cyclase/phosphodiesterase [Teredinibacter turnerae]|uniref:putative bifunctional diguanylate cyclase/phosphodiesterase n=1 Tax=Teredinibacter turnerae TaxID=2426 RepID=UPI0004105BC0|nr:EAL domain-containing protein [Teredinibacter turnerae]